MIGVFGANGFMGKHLTRHLVGHGMDVTAVARDFDATARVSGARLFRGDLRDASAMGVALSGIETVVQLMGTSTPAQGNARTTKHIHDDVIPHVDFLNQCVEAGVKRVVFASSGGTVYGPTSGVRPTSESDTTDPISSHGVTKLTVEHFIKLHGHLDGLEYVILRIGNPYGPGQVLRNGQGLIPALIDRHRAGLPITVYGDGSTARDYVYIDDVVRALRAAVERPSPRSLVLNVGSGTRHTVLEVVRSIESILGARFVIDFMPARKADVSSIALDISRISAELGWKPEVDFEEGLRRTLATVSQ